MLPEENSTGPVLATARRISNATAGTTGEHDNNDNTSSVVRSQEQQMHEEEETSRRSPPQQRHESPLHHPHPQQLHRSKPHPARPALKERVDGCESDQTLETIAPSPIAPPSEESEVETTTPATTTASSSTEPVHTTTSGATTTTGTTNDSRRHHHQQQPPIPPAQPHRRNLTLTSSGGSIGGGAMNHNPPSLPSSPSRGALASSEEESVAELEDVSEAEVSVAELSEGECSCDSVETTARTDAGEPEEMNLLTKVARLAPKATRVPPTATAAKAATTICSPSTAAVASGRKRVPSNATTGSASSSSSLPRKHLKSAMKVSSHYSTAAAANNSSSISKKDSSMGAPRTRGVILASDDAAVELATAKFSGRKVELAVSSSNSHSSREKNSSRVVYGDSFNKKLPAMEGASSPMIGDIKIPAGAASSSKLMDAADAAKQDEHRPMSLPKFTTIDKCMWTSTHEANCPSEDRSSSLVNVLLQPLPPNFDSETQLPPLEPDYNTLIRLNLWSVIDGHGGGCVATYASEVLLPHIAASISRALGCAIVDRGVCTVNGQLRDANALDLDGLIKTSDRGSLGNPNSIHYRSPFERSDSEEEDAAINIMSEVEDDAVTTAQTMAAPPPRRSPPPTDEEDNGGPRISNNGAKTPPPSSLAGGVSLPSSEPGGSVSSVKTSVKTAASPNHGEEALLGTHSPREVAAITRAITDSFLAVDEGWINSIDPVATHQTSCQSNGRWNSGACALVVFTIQRLDWTSVSEPDREKELRGPEKNRGHDTSQNRDAARRRMLDFASRAKSASSLSTVSSTSSLTTEEAVNASGLESEITETEGEDDDDKSTRADTRRRFPPRSAGEGTSKVPKESLISPPGGCSCHCYRAHDAILYTAHVGDCRAVMLGSAPPRTIKVRDSFADHPDTTDDESSHHSSDETECLSSSDHDADSSDEDDIEMEDSSRRKQPPPPAATAVSVASSASPQPAASTPSYMTYVRRPARRSRRRPCDDTGPFIALPPLEREFIDNDSKIAVGIGDLERQNRRKHRGFTTGVTSNNGNTGGTSGIGGGSSAVAIGDSRNNGGGGNEKDASDTSTSSQDSDDQLPLINLPPVTRPIDLTTDHSAYNPAEVTAVLRRCNNAPRAISAGVGGGIKRVAGSLAVTRALGDAYLKTPLLSFLPYKSHAPYITARPEVNCRPVVKGGDKVLILATDGVWERAGGEDVLRWVRNFYAERIAKAERRSNRRLNKDTSMDLPPSVILSPNNDDCLAVAGGSNSGDGGRNTGGDGGRNTGGDGGRNTGGDGGRNTGGDGGRNTGGNGNGNPGRGGALELAEQEQERQDDQNQKMDLHSIDVYGRGRSRKRGIDNMPRSPSPPSNKRRKRGGRRGNAVEYGWPLSSSVADVIVRRVLNKVRRARNISSLHALMSLPQGRARRSKHDDITSCVVDLSAFVS